MNPGLLDAFGNTIPRTILITEVLYDVTLQAEGVFDTVDVWPSGLPKGYDRFEIHGSLRSTASAFRDFGAIFFNDDLTSSNYRWINDGRSGTDFYGTTISDSFVGYFAADSSEADTFSFLIAHIPRPESTKRKKYHVLNHCRRDDFSMDVTQIGGTWISAEPINRIRVRLDGHPTALFAPGSSLQILGYRQIPLSNLLA